VTITFIGRDQASAAMRSIGSNTSKTTTTVGKLTGALKKAGKAAATALAAAAAAAGYFAFQFAKSAVSAAGDFEQSMNVLQNSLDITGNKMREVERFALRMGSKTAFSAQEAGDAMIELAKSGLTEAQIKGGALAATMDVAATEGLALADTAGIVANAMSVFNIKASKATDVADVLAGGAAASTASVKSLSIALGQVGPGAVNAGLSINETVAALSAFDQAGIKGSDAGTSLKTMLAALVPKSEAAAKSAMQMGLDFTTADGSFKSLTDIAGILQDKLGGLSQALRVQTLNTIFGSDATRAATVLMQEGERGIQNYIDATMQSGAAAKMAEARMEGWNGAVEQLQGAWETFKIKFGKQILPLLAEFTRWIAEKAVPWISKKLVPAVKQFSAWIKDEAVPYIQQKIIPALIDWYDVFRSKWLPTIKDAWEVGRDFAKLVLDIAANIGDLFATENSDGIKRFFELIVTSINNALIPVKALLQFWGYMIDKWQWVIDNASAVGSAIGKIGDAAGAVGGAVKSVVPGLAAGGHIVGRAGGGWTMVGEHGPELISNRGFVKPHSASMGAGGGGVTLVQNFNAPQDPVAVGRETRKALLSLKRAEGGRALGLA
jgi:TP901 family phage tail tape measure protein